MSKKNASQLVVVLGLGKTGVSCVRYLLKKGHNVVVIDTRENPPGLSEVKNIPIYTGGWHPEILKQAHTIVISPGLSLQEPCLIEARQQGIEIIGDIELFAREVTAPVIAITGSNGKTTVTTLVGEMARAAGLDVRVGGNIGTPALDLLGDTEPDLYVLELSSFQLETTDSLKPVVATVLNISPDHLDRYASFEDYKAAKHRIYRNAKIKIDNPAPTVKLNAAAALAIGTAINLPQDVMLKVLREFPGLPHRCQWVREHNGVVWYNDSKGTNVGATLAAIEGLADTVSGKLILIAGGIGKGADFSPLREPIQQHVSNLILFGQDADKLEQALQGATLIQQVNSLESAVTLANQIAQSGNAVLLSPACSSFDMFAGFEDRGNQFMKFVRSL